MSKECLGVCAYHDSMEKERQEDRAERKEIRKDFHRVKTGLLIVAFGVAVAASGSWKAELAKVFISVASAAEVAVHGGDRGQD